MYLPKHFQQSDVPTLHEFIERHSFGLLVSPSGAGPQASHLPLLLNRSIGPYGEIIGHLARANDQWQTAAGTVVLCAFSGPHAYISPVWYEAENVVPTWNYTAVHAYGQFEAIHDAAELTEIVRAYVNRYERGRPLPWQFDGSTEFNKRLVAQIVGFRMRIERLAGKFKLSQNHPRERREKVIAALERQAGEDALSVAALIRQTL